MAWTQLPLFTDHQVTEIIVKVGLVGHHHAQWQLEARDANGTLVAMVSVHHFDMAQLAEQMRVVLTEMQEIRQLRHDPF